MKNSQKDIGDAVCFQSSILDAYNFRNSAHKMKFSFKDFFSKCDQIRRSHLLKKSLIENFIFLCSVKALDSSFLLTHFSPIFHFCTNWKGGIKVVLKWDNFQRIFYMEHLRAVRAIFKRRSSNPLNAGHIMWAYKIFRRRPRRRGSTL